MRAKFMPTEMQNEAVRCFKNILREKKANVTKARKRNELVFARVYEASVCAFPIVNLDPSSPYFNSPPG